MFKTNNRRLFKIKKIVIVGYIIFKFHTTPLQKEFSYLVTLQKVYI